MIRADLGDGDDAGVIEATRRLRFTEEPFAELVGDIDIDIESEGLESHFAVDEGVPGEIDDTHGAPAERLLDLIATHVSDRHLFYFTVAGGQKENIVPIWRSTGRFDARFQQIVPHE